MLLLFIFKLLDCIFGTLKNIFLYKNKHFLSSLVFAISTYFYLTMVVALNRNDSPGAKLLICLATFIGTYVPSKFVHTLDQQKERLWIYDISTSSLEAGKVFADSIREYDVPIKTYKARDKNMEKILCCKIYCDSKEQSRIVNNLIPSDFNYNIMIPYGED